MTATRAWIIYSIVRIASFVLPFVAIMLILPDWQWNWLAGVAIGAIISASVSQIFLGKPRAVMAEQMAARRKRAESGEDRTALDREEDALLDAEDAPESPADPEATT